MRIRWTTPARRDMAAILQYLGARRESAVARVEEQILAAVEHLAAFPQLGRPGQVAGTRELVIGRAPYLVIYAEGPAFITVLRVKHTAQQWPPDPPEDSPDTDQ